MMFKKKSLLIYQTVKNSNDCEDVFVTYLIVMTKYPGQTNLMEKGFDFTYCFIVLSIV